MIIGIVIALDENSVIFRVVSYAWAGLGASFGPLVLCSLYWRRTTCPARSRACSAVRSRWWFGITSSSRSAACSASTSCCPAFIVWRYSCIVVVSKLTAEPSQEIYDEFDHYTEARMDEDVNPTAA